MSNHYVYMPFRKIDFVLDCEDFDLDEKSKLLDGWIYMMSNPAMPGIVKIGMTTTSPERRCKELSSSTSVPVPFELVVAYHVDDPLLVERSVHESLKDKRVNESREFFRATEVDLNEAIQDFGATKHGDCKIDFMLSNSIACFDKFPSKTKTVKITEEAYNDLECAYGDPNDLAEMAIRFMTQHLNCNISYKDGQFCAIPDPCYSSSPETCPPEAAPSLIKTVARKDIFGGNL